MLRVDSDRKRLRLPLAGFFVLLCLLTLGACGGNPSVEVYDNARVLDVAQVQKAASSLPNPVAIYTTNTFRGTRTTFQQVAMQKLKGNPDLIVMAIDTGHRYLYIAHGSNVALSNAGIQRAISSFSARFDNGDYTNASIAALHALQRSIGERPISRAGSGGGLLSGPTLLCCIIPLLLVIFLALFVASRRRRAGGGMFGGGPFGQRGQPYDQQGPLDQGPFPGQGGQGGGMNPWMAGGLGAAAGGLAGYELGKRQGEREPSTGDTSSGEAGAGGGFGADAGGETGAGGGFGSGGDAWNDGGSDFGSDDFDQGGGGNF